MKRTSRAGLAKETVEISQQGAYTLPDGRVVDIRTLVERCVASTQHLSPEELEQIRARVLALPASYRETIVEVRNETTIEGIVRLAGNVESTQLGVLNFASAKNPGGGFLGGSQAQEESLARSSALYASLSAPVAAEFYTAHREGRSCLYSDRMILSPSCPVFRYDDGTLMDSPRVVTFITSAAPNVGAIRQHGGEDLPLVPETLRRRGELILALAADAGCESLILGAWGCGVFRNDPCLVSRTFADLLSAGCPWHGRFAKVCFSVLDTSEDLKIFQAFQGTFG